MVVRRLCSRGRVARIRVSLLVVSRRSGWLVRRLDVGVRVVRRCWGCLVLWTVITRLWIGRRFGVLLNLLGGCSGVLILAV